MVPGKIGRQGANHGEGKDGGRRGTVGSKDQIQWTHAPQSSHSTS